MKPLSGLVARTLCLLAAIGLTALIVFVHAADRTRLGAHAVVASGVTRVALASAAPASPGVASRQPMRSRTGVLR